MLMILVAIFDSKVSGYDLMVGFDGKIDRELGAKSSEKLQRGRVANFFKECLEGIFSESIIDLQLYIRDWDDELETKFLTKKKGHRR